ncbi:MAG: hypothetical protein QM771_10805 [Nitrospira sp.]
MPPFKIIRIGCVIGLVVLFTMEAATPAQAVPIIRDQCNQTSGDGQGHSCPGPNDLLIRPRYPDGTCGDWMRCSPNADGKTYDCAHATNPTSSVISGALKNFLGPRATVLEPGRTPGVKSSSIFSGPNAPILRRGIDEEGQGQSPTVPDERIK